MTNLKQQLEQELKDLEQAYKTKRMTLNEYCDTVYQVSQTYKRKQQTL